jgi:epsilon-lactone hydrolase
MNRALVEDPVSLRCLRCYDESETVVPSAELEFVNDLLRSFSMADLTLVEQRALMDRTASAPADGTQISPVDANGVRAEWVVAPGVRSSAVLLNLHGGAYSLGSLASNRRISALLSAATDRRVLSIEYRLAPEHRFPAALDDTLAAYHWLLAQNVAALDIAIAGNSAGGGLALATLVALRDQGSPLPCAAVALSPWTDLTGSGESVNSCASSDFMLTADGLHTSAMTYAVAEHHRNPYASPLFAELHGLPPILLQASRAEILRDDTIRFATRARECGTSVTVELYDDMPHVWHTFAGVLPEADHAIAAIGTWLRTVAP